MFETRRCGSLCSQGTPTRGTIFGGVILSHIDLAGAIAASRQAPRNFVTRAMREVGFMVPVYVGEVVSFYTSVLRHGRTSVTIQVLVEAERSKEPWGQIKVTEAEVVYVAVDEAGQPISLN